MTTAARALPLAPLTVLPSAEDRSVNLVVPTEDGGAIEARYVRRVPEYFIAYLSSHTGCRMACRFCHLTATGQTMEAPVDMAGYLGQADRVLAHYDSVEGAQGRAGRVNYNWMARGDALANPVMLGDSATLFGALGDRASARGLVAKFNVSTIMPLSLGDRDLADILGDDRSMLYYSLYTVDERFRRRWMPRAMPAGEALDRIADYQRRTGRLVTLHWAFIAGENDSVESVEATMAAVTERGIRAKFNLVRYNAYSPAQGAESAEGVIERNFELIRTALGHAKSRIVPRVGFDVKASCGMFVEGTGARRPSCASTGGDAER